MKEKLKSFGYYILGIAGIFLLLLISIAMINGAVWVGEHVLQWLMNFSWIVLFINLFILLPLGLFKKTRIVGGIGMYVSSYVFGLTLWFLGLLLTYFKWGFFGILVGLILGGVGVVPVAMLAMLFGGDFFTFTTLIVLAILALGTQILGLYLINKEEEKTQLLE
jgi:hypothetical protein